jgi:hypothetical protein
MPDFGIFRGFNEKLFGDKLYAGQLPINLGMIASDFSLLDIYPNAAAAYSLRRLKASGYTGSAIEVRRTNLDVADIGFTSTGELDTAALLAFTGTGALDNGFVTKWYDQSGNGRDATQTTAANQPQIVSSGSVILENGKPAIQFDGSDDNLDANNVASVFSGTDLNYSFINLLKSNLSTLGLRVSIGFGNSTDNSPVSSISTSELVLNELRNSLRGDVLIPDKVLRGGLINAQSLVFSGGNYDSMNLYLNNSLQATDTTNINTITFNRFAIGCLSRAIKSSFWQGVQQEIILYSSDQLSNRTGIEDNINDFYSIY